MCLILQVHRLMDAVALVYDGSFRKSGDPVSPMYSVFELSTTPQVQEPGAYGSEESQEGDDGVKNLKSPLAQVSMGILVLLAKCRMGFGILLMMNESW